jgi:hypothetical protein
MSDEQQQQQTTVRPPLTVHLVVESGTCVGVHRSVRAASLDAWLRCLRSRLGVPIARDSSPGTRGSSAFRVESWEVGECRAKSSWLVEVPRSADEAKVRAWVEEMGETSLVPRVLWNKHMPPVSDENVTNS